MILNSIVALLVTLHHSPSLLVKLTVCVVFISITVLHDGDREATVVANKEKRDTPILCTTLEREKYKKVLS